jgi:Protein of unknown function (DUF416)
MLRRIRALVGGSRGGTTARRKIPLTEYDEALKADLKRLPRRTQAAFAAACAERLYPAYAAFQMASRRDDQGLIRRTLDHAWEGARSGSVKVADPADLVEQCVGLVPDDESEDAIPAYADDAIASTAYAIQAAAGLDDGAAGWAAQRGTDSLDNFLLSNDFDLSQPDADQLVWEHPLVVAEISRRETDLIRLTTASDWEAAVDAVRADAAGVSVLPLERLHQQA